MKKANRYEFVVESGHKYRINVWENHYLSSSVVDVEKMTKTEKHWFMRWMLDAMDKLTRKQ